MKDIFVGNLDYETSEDELRQLFAAYGPVDRVRIVTDGYSGQPRGFAFVEMASAGDADKAITELNGTQLHSRKLDVNEARRRPERIDGGRVICRSSVFRDWRLRFRKSILYQGAAGGAGSLGGSTPASDFSREAI